jgi:hypothetical protein
MTGSPRLPFAVLLLASLLGCSSAAAPGAAPAATAAPVATGVPVAFRAASGADFAVASTFEGTYVVQSDRVNVLVSRATLRLRNVGQYRGPRRVTGLRLALGEGNTGSNWRRTNESEPVPIDRVVRPGEEVTLDSLILQIPLRRPLPDMGRRWIVFEIGEAREAAGGGTLGSSYAHSQRFDGTPP